MKATISPPGSPSSDPITTIANAIRGVSARARNSVITADSRLLDDLALDSLDLVAVVIELQDQFGVEIDPDELPALLTVGDLAASLARQARSAA